MLAFARAGVLCRLGRGAHPVVVFAAYLLASGAARVSIDFLRTNPPVAVGPTAPQLWSLAVLAVGVVLILVTRRRGVTAPEGSW